MTFEQRKQERQALVQHLMAQDWDVFGTLKFVNGRTIGRHSASKLLRSYWNKMDRMMFGNHDKAIIVINEIDEMDLRSVQPVFREFMDDKRHLIRFIATTNHKSRMMGAILSRFRVLELDSPSNADWVDRAHTILQAEGLRPTTQDVAQMLQSFDGSARDLIDFLEETVIASKAAAQ
jgi:DNA polymerase III delta prime subunit